MNHLPTLDVVIRPVAKFSDPLSVGRNVVLHEVWNPPGLPLHPTNPGLWRRAGYSGCYIPALFDDVDTLGRGGSKEASLPFEINANAGNFPFTFRALYKVVRAFHKLSSNFRGI